MAHKIKVTMFVIGECGRIYECDSHTVVKDQDNITVTATWNKGFFKSPILLTHAKLVLGNKQYRMRLKEFMLIGPYDELVYAWKVEVKKLTEALQP